MMSAAIVEGEGVCFRVRRAVQSKATPGVLVSVITRGLPSLTPGALIAAFERSPDPK